MGAHGRLCAHFKVRIIFVKFLTESFQTHFLLVVDDQLDFRQNNQQNSPEMNEFFRKWAPNLKAVHFLVRL